MKNRILSNYTDIILKIYATAYDDERRYFDKLVSLWVYYVTRPISIALTPMFIWVGISANQVTFLGFLAGLLSFGLGTSGYMFQAAILYNIFLIADSIDGNIARYLKTSSKKGEYYDAVTGDIINYLVIPFMGLGIYINKIKMNSGLDVKSEYLFLLALISSIAYLLSSLFAQRRKIILNTQKDNGPTRLGKNSKPGNFEIIIRNSFGFAFIAPFSLILTYFKMIDLLIIYDFAISIILTVYTIQSGLKLIDDSE